MFPSTISVSDLYGANPPGRKPGETTAPVTQEASGKSTPVNEKTPAYFWVSLVGMLVVIRLLWEKAK